MVDDTLASLLVLGGITVGLVVMLWGVSLNAGQALNGPMIVGGVVVLAAITALSSWTMRVDAE